MSDIKRMDITEFRELGFLQEVNRRFLHPLGLALEVVLEPDGTEHLGGVWDYRDDPEGMIFVAQDIKEVLRKAGNVRLERRRHTAARRPCSTVCRSSSPSSPQRSLLRPSSDHTYPTTEPIMGPGLAHVPPPEEVVVR